MALNSSGTATASVLYGPYGGVRYTNGAMPTDYVFTGQSDDTTTGLDDYGARYYDPSIGQFTSADSDGRGGLNRYAYVHDDPETFTDPTGHMIDCGGGSCDPPPPCTPHCGGSGGNGGNGGNGGGSGGGSGAGGTGHHECVGCKVIEGGGDGGPPQLRYDKQGRCANYYTCNQDQVSAASKIRSQGDRDQEEGIILILFGDLAATLLDVTGNQVQRAIKDLLGAFGWIPNYLVPIMQGKFGRDSWEANLAQTAVEAVNGLGTVLNGFYGVAWLAGAAMTVIRSFMAGPGSWILQVVTIAAGGLARLGAAYGYWLLNHAQDEYSEADHLAYETTYQWCQGNDHCAPGWLNYGAYGGAE